MKADTQSRTWTAALAQAGFEDREVGLRWPRRALEWPLLVLQHPPPPPAMESAGSQGPKKGFPLTWLQWAGSTVLLVIWGKVLWRQPHASSIHHLGAEQRDLGQAGQAAQEDIGTAKGLLCLTRLLPGTRAGVWGIPRGVDQGRAWRMLPAVRKRQEMVAGGGAAAEGPALGSL